MRGAPPPMHHLCRRWEIGMVEDARIDGMTRRTVVKAACAGGVGLASALASPRSAGATDEAIELVERLMGRTPTESDRLRLEMPSIFANGYTVPLAVEVDSPMNEADHVRRIHVLAPHNPLIQVATFHFTPEGGRARVSARIRLAQPQYVLAVAEMSDGALLMTRTWVEVATNGCA
jgi:sulfur-oxidizing protein SoxY